MGSRISPENNSVSLLLKPGHIIPPTPIPIPTAKDVPGVGRQKFPMNLMTGSELGMKVRPEGESMDVVEAVTVEASNWVVQMAMGYKGGGGKMRSVIPKKRKLVKTMMYDSIKNFLISLFSSVSSSAGAPP